MHSQKSVRMEMLLICEHVINLTAPLRSASGVPGAGAQLPVEQELSQGTGTASRRTPSLVNKSSQKREIAQVCISKISNTVSLEINFIQVKMYCNSRFYLTRTLKL